jgi:hypothetical protein
MQEILDALRTLPHAVTPGPADPDVAAAADVARGHRALSRRRHRRIVFSSAALAAVAVVGVAVGNPARVDSTTHPAAADSGATKGSGAARPVTKVQLVAYTGAQPAGFRVSTVPAGWQVTSSDRYSFVVAPPGASATASQTAPAGSGQAGQRQLHGTSPQAHPGGGQAVSFVGRIAVMLQGQSTMPSQSRLTKVSINGKEGLLGFAEGGTGSSRDRWLIFPEGGTGSSRDRWLIFPSGQGSKVLVQVPVSLGLTSNQIVHFAQGITVTSAAVPGKG